MENLPKSSTSAFKVVNILPCQHPASRRLLTVQFNPSNIQEAYISFSTMFLYHTINSRCAVPEFLLFVRLSRPATCKILLLLTSN
jgi:hypothetical protein